MSLTAGGYDIAEEDVFGLDGDFGLSFFSTNKQQSRHRPPESVFTREKLEYASINWSDYREVSTIQAQ